MPLALKPFKLLVNAALLSGTTSLVNPHYGNHLI